MRRLERLKPKSRRLVAAPIVIHKLTLDDVIIVRDPATIVELFTLVLDLTDAGTAVFADVVREFDKLKDILLKAQQS